MSQPYTVLVIDPDDTAARDLSIQLTRQPGPPTILRAAGVRIAERALVYTPVDWLFIRIECWDDYQKIAHEARYPPPRIVFLSGREERYADYLNHVLDAHLQPPYSRKQVTRLWDHMTQTGFTKSSTNFTQAPTDFFFLKVHDCYTPVPYRDVHSVRQSGRFLLIKTRHTEYRVPGTLDSFRARIIIPLIELERGHLINIFYEPDDPNDPHNRRSDNPHNHRPNSPHDHRPNSGFFDSGFTDPSN